MEAQPALFMINSGRSLRSLDLFRDVLVAVTPCDGGFVSAPRSRAPVGREGCACPFSLAQDRFLALFLPRRAAAWDVLPCLGEKISVADKAFLLVLPFFQKQPPLAQSAARVSAG